MSVRNLFELTHQEAAALAGEVSLLLTRDTITKRDVLRALNHIDRLTIMGEKLREAAKIPKKEDEK